MEMKFTICTPAYNRAHTLGRLYESLLVQSLTDFEWIVVDDGSNDNTSQLVREMEEQNKINIRYFHQSNSGKHVAVNRALEAARGELFFIVDSDDFIPENSLETIWEFFLKIKEDHIVAGVVGLKCHFDGRPVGGNPAYDSLLCSAIDFRFKHNGKGDQAEIYRTEVLRNFPFPEVPEERFCPEAIVHNRIAAQYKLLYFAKNTYYCEYLSDGLSSSIIKIRARSPQLAMMTYAELRHMDIPCMEKIKSVINYWRFSFWSDKRFKDKRAAMPGILDLLGIIPAFIIYVNDKKYVI